MRNQANARRDRMILTIWRHAQAGAAVNDRDRELTPAGEDDLGFGCQQFRSACALRAIEPPTTILHSPFTRTTQTAEIIAGAFAHAKLKCETALQPESSIGGVDDAITPFFQGPTRHLLLISHQPLVSRLLDYYLGRQGLVPALSPGGMATIELSTPAADCGILQFWALPPEYEAGI